MYLSELHIENFRLFGEDEHALDVSLKPGLTAIVGENDSGKTAIIDALRCVLGTRDQEFFRLEETDFHLPPDTSERRTEVRIQCKFEDLAPQDISAFIEYLTYEEQGERRIPALYVNWKASAMGTKAGLRRRSTSIEVRSGHNADGPQLVFDVRNLLSATYLRPLRDAERALSAGRGSRLSQILQHTEEIREGEDFNPDGGPIDDPKTLSILGIGDYANALLGSHQGVEKARSRLNTEYLKNLSFSGDELSGSVSVSGSKGDATFRLRQLLEKLDLELRDKGESEPPPSRGLGSNNLLFMACELLLLGSEGDGFPFLLIEEPEAHLHPQRQIRLMHFLQDKATETRANRPRLQILVTTHSPNLASAINLNNLVLLHNGKAFQLDVERTQLEATDYGFLERFLDVTKANLFFARGLLIVEGDAENILLPTLARLIGRDFSENGVSIVNVGGTGLRRFARIFQRKNPQLDGLINIPVACVTDFDVMPNCAPEILGKCETGKEWPKKADRRWRAKSDFNDADLDQRRQTIREKASGQRVETFVADEWTLEYDIAYFGLAKELWIAIHFAKEDAAINQGTKTCRKIASEALRKFAGFSKDLTTEEFASHVCLPIFSNPAISKATTAQYLACILELRYQKGTLTSESLRATLPPYVVKAIDYVTAPMS